MPSRAARPAHRTGPGYSGRPTRSRQDGRTRPACRGFRSYDSNVRMKARIPAGRCLIHGGGGPGGGAGSSTSDRNDSRMNAGVKCSAGSCSSSLYFAQSFLCSVLQSQLPAHAGSSKARLSSRAGCRAATANAAAASVARPMAMPVMSGTERHGAALRPGRRHQCRGTARGYRRHHGEQHRRGNRSVGNRGSR